jgi:hypothetical protein
MDNVARHTFPIRHLVSTISDFLADCAYAERRLAELRLAPGQAVFKARVPQTYAEFLYLTSGVLPHEPSASARAVTGR